jgi:nitrite reductase/ring-hydroxylating ferredoxin subunit
VRKRPLALCRLDELEDPCAKGFEFDGHPPFFLVCREGVLYAYVNSCPHLGITLEWKRDAFLTRDGALIQCSLHGAQFAPETGFCIWGPCQGDRLRALPVEVRNGVVWLAANP